MCIVYLEMQAQLNKSQPFLDLQTLTNLCFETIVLLSSGVPNQQAQGDPKHTHTPSLLDASQAPSIQEWPCQNLSSAGLVTDAIFCCLFLGI